MTAQKQAKYERFKELLKERETGVRYWYEGQEFCSLPLFPIVCGRYDELTELYFETAEEQEAEHGYAQRPTEGGLFEAIRNRKHA